MISVALALAVVGLLFITFFTLDVGHLSSTLARWHSESSRKHPRYYAVTDPFSLARRRSYWRFYGAVMGAVLLIVALALFLAARS